jgi:hypothetical protein
VCCFVFADIDECPVPGSKYQVITQVKSYLQFFVKDNSAWGRKYSDLGEGAPLNLETKTRSGVRASTRSANVDKLREAMVAAVTFLAVALPMHDDWKEAALKHNAGASSAYGLTSCNRFVTASGPKSPFRSAGWLCYDEVLTTMKGWLQHARYDKDGVRWQASSASTPHSIAKKLGAMELCRLGVVHVPPLPSCGDSIEPTDEHYKLWDRLRGTCDATCGISAGPEEDACADRPPDTQIDVEEAQHDDDDAQEEQHGCSAAGGGDAGCCTAADAVPEAVEALCALDAANGDAC